MPCPKVSQAVFLAVFLSQLKQGTMLSCYACSRCNDPFDVTSAKKTPHDCTACIKTISSEGSISRTCYFAKMPYRGCQTLAHHQTTTTTCYCDNSDRCNTGSSHVVPSVLLVSTAPVTWTLIHRFLVH